jgi:hypothetical protein
MPALFMKVSQKFTLKNQEDSDPVVPSFQDVSDVNLEVSIYAPDSPKIAFRIRSSELVSGHITGAVVGDNVEIDADAVVKVNVKPDYVDNFLDKGTKWEFLGVEGVVADVEGLETESYEEYNRFHDKTYTFYRYFIPVATAKKEKELS